MRLGIGLGLFKAGLISAGVRIFSAFQTRVIGDGGTVEAGTCVVNGINGSALLQQASLLLIPSGYKGGKLYAEIPTNGNGDLTWTRSGTANRTNASGNIELMGSGVPRLSYMYGSCPAVLLEPQRTNLALWSNDFTNAIWTKSGATITANTTTSPDGTQNASTVTFTASNQFVAQTCLTLSTNATASVWLLGTSGETIQIACGGLDQLVTLTGSWQRFSLNRASVTNTAVNINTFGGATARVVRIYGFQAEVGSYPTTYIPTTSATATRVADSFSRNNIYTNGLISASGGTWFVELRGNVSVTNASTDRGVFVADTTASTGNALAIRRLSAGRNQIVKVVSGSSTTLFTTTTDTTKIAIKWNGATADVFVNGTKQVSATAFATTLLENLGTRVGEEPYQFIQQMALFSTPLSDTDCTTLTTL